jgi:hypothetical protein
MKYENLITYLSKDMANVEVLQTDKRTGQKLYAPDLSIRGHKKYNILFDLRIVVHTMNRNENRKIFSNESNCEQLNIPHVLTLYCA